LEPEEETLAFTEPLQVRMSVLAMIIREVGYAEGFQRLGVEFDGSPEVRDRQNNVVKHGLRVNAHGVCRMIVKRGRPVQGGWSRGLPGCSISGLHPWRRVGTNIGKNLESVL